MQNARWRVGCRLSADPQKVADELSVLGNDITPQEIVDAARDETSELHKCFTWDDTEAAEKWRKQEARFLIHNLVWVQPEVKESVPVRLYYKTDNETGYKPTRLIMQNPDEYQSLLKRAMAELTVFRDKYKSLSELEGVFEQIDALSA